MLCEHSGTVSGMDAIVQAVLCHTRGVPGRLEVLKYLLNQDSPIDEYAFYDFMKFVSVVAVKGLLDGLHIVTIEGKKDMVELLLNRGRTSTSALSKVDWSL